MTTHESEENQPSLFMDDENRLTRIEGITGEALE
jgi:hypothetical protein